MKPLSVLEPTRSYSSFMFEGKERLRADGINEYDQGARRYTAAFPFFTTPDRKASSTPWLSPYSFCAANPVMNIDPTGNWYVKVSASSDRGNHPYATFRVYNRNDKLIYRTIVKVRGQDRNRMVQKADTPTGIYSDLKWKSTGDGTDYDTERYGPNDLLALTYKEGEAKGSGRSGILLHGGRSQFPELVSTHGCIRIADEDIAELKLVTDIVSFIDPNDKPENVYVENDLQESVTYQERTSYKKDTEYFITLDEIIVYPKKEDN